MKTTRLKFSGIEKRLFWISLWTSFVLLFVYRLMFRDMPLWFEEIVLKAFLFGFPVFLFSFYSRKWVWVLGLDASKFWRGIFYGIAIGGMFGFAGMIASSLKRGQVLIPNLLAAPQFWGVATLAFATSLFESLFFFSFILGVFSQIKKDRAEALMYAVVIFLLFHLPNLLLRFSLSQALISISILSLFAIGQGIIYLKTRNYFTLVWSHAIWGLVLLVYTL